MNNPQFAKAKEILSGNHPGDEVAELARAQVHATLAVAYAIGVIYEAIIDNIDKKVATPTGETWYSR